MLEFLFFPKSIAIIGAPREKGKLGFTILNNIVKLGYKGKIYPVNPKAKKILGLACFKSVLDIKDSVDLAMIVVPANAVLSVLKECVQKEIKSAIIVSAGFKESGSHGALLEKEISKLAKDSGIHLIGPNCLGVLNPYSQMNASFAEGMPEKGNVGFISQSGAIVTAVLDWAKNNAVGFSRVVSFGNKAGLDESDLLDYLIQDKDTKKVALYIENIEDGKRFMESAKNIAKIKPVAILKAGRTDTGKKTAMSHTGAMCGDDAAFDAVCKEAGLLRADTISDLFDFLKFPNSYFCCKKMIFPQKIAIVTNAGGPGVMVMDALDVEENKKILQPVIFSKKTLDVLAKYLPASANIKNPIDVIGDAKADRYEFAIKTVLEDKDVDILLVVLTPQTVTEKEKTAEIIADMQKKYKNKLVVISFIGGENLEKALQILKKNNMPNFECPERAIKSLSKLLFSIFVARELNAKNQYLPKMLRQNEHDVIAEILLSAKINKFSVLDYSEIEKIRNAYSLPYIQSHIATNEKEALRTARKIGYPVVLKTANKDIVHKTDIGGVKKGIKNDEDLRKNYRELVKSVNKYSSKTIHLVLVQKEFAGKEILIGMKRDEIFGPMIMFGLGGVYAEILKDVSLRAAPIDIKKAEQMMRETKVYNLLKGARGESSVNFEAISDILQKISNLAMEFRDIKEIDINPLMVNEKEAKIVDMRVIV